MPFQISQEDIREIHKTLKRGLKSFEWNEASLLSLISPPLKKSNVYWATIGLRDCGTAASVPALKELASFPNQDIRACAILTIGQICGPSETPYYAACLIDQKYKVKDFALWAIGEFGDHRALQALQTYVRKNREKLSDLRPPPQAQQEVLAYLYRHVGTHPQALALLKDFSFLVPPLKFMGDVSRTRFLSRCPGITTIYPAIGFNHDAQ